MERIYGSCINPKKFLFILIVICVLCSSGCETRNITPDFEDSISMDDHGVFGTFNDNGVFFTRNGIVYIFDPISKISTPLCSKVNCDHRGASPDNSNPTCDAYLGQSVGYSAIIGDTLYYVAVPDDVNGSKGMFVKDFCKAEKNGTKRKRIYRADDILFGTYGRYENGYFLYAYYNEENEKGEELDKTEVGMCVLNLETEEMLRIRPGNWYGARIWGMTILDDVLYYGLYYNTESLKKIDYSFLTDTNNKDFLTEIGKTEVWKYDLNTGYSERCFEHKTGINQVYIGYGYIYYSYDKNREHVLKELSTNKEYHITREVNIAPFIFDEGLLFLDDGEIEIWRYGKESTEKIGSIPKDETVCIQWITKRWVYALAFNDNCHKTVFCRREDFMKGNIDWNEYDIDSSTE